MSDMMALIRQGVKLRSVSNSISAHSSPPSDSHTQHLQEALLRISTRLHMSDTEDNGEGSDNGDEDEDDDFDFD